MLIRLMKQILLIAALLCFGHAMAQTEPTLNQVYEAAQSGRLKDAQQMMNKVLAAHPNSGKAHFVQSELFARQGQLGQARSELSTAERLAPGLPFAKSESVQSLRSQLAAPVTNTASPAQTNRVAAPALARAPAPVPAKSAPFPWMIVLLVGAAAVGLWMFFRRKIPAPTPMRPPQAYPMQNNGLNGPQTMGMNGGAPMAPQGMGPGPGYGQNYGQQGYPQQQQPAGGMMGGGMGGNLMGGLATGLAVGAGVMAAQAIGKNLMGGDHASTGAASNTTAASTPAPANNDFEPITDNGNSFNSAGNANSDLGGSNFGVNDANSWDDGTSFASNDDGGSWDDNS